LPSLVLKIMMNKSEFNVTVIGAGTMGNGIAHVFAQHGFPVTLVDISDDALAKGIATIEKNLGRMVVRETITDDEKQQTLSRISTATQLESGAAHADLVVEAATENLELKLKIFRSLSDICREDTILASNTSSISITRIAAVTARPGQVIGMHFMNPVPVMKLVEIIRGYSTTDAVAEKVTTLSESLGKIPVVVNDYPGFVANRILIPMINEAIYTLWEGVAGVYEIDQVMKLGMAHPMGPLQLADFIGLDVMLAITRVLHDGFAQPKYAPCPLLVNMVQAGKLGVKSGEGFYIYTPGEKQLVVSPSFKGK
jgi:3-hydroxybutyryl-CoA dehydrogenase